MSEGTSMFHSLMDYLMFFYCLATMMLGTSLCIIGAGVLNDSNKHFHDILKSWRDATGELLFDIPEILPKPYTTLQFPVYDVLILARNVSIACTLLGMFFICTSISGFFLSRKSKVLPILAYTMYVGLLSAAFVGVFFAGKSLIAKKMKESLKDYSGLADRSKSGRNWNLIMVGLGCCGVDSYKDFENLDNWPPQDLFDYKVDKTEFQKYPEYSENSKCSEEGGKVSCKWFNSNNFLTPMACCKTLENIYDGCHVRPEGNETKNPEDNWMDHGCSTKLVEYLSSKYLIIVLFIFMLLFSIVCVMLILRLMVGGEEEEDEASASYTGYGSGSESGEGSDVTGSSVDN